MMKEKFWLLAVNSRNKNCWALKYPFKNLMAELAVLDILQFATVIRKSNDVNNSILSKLYNWTKIK